MAHPFTKILEKALAKSTSIDNVLLIEAEKLRERGYRPAEIFDVLEQMRSGRLDDAEVEIIDEVREEFEAYQ